ncbi:choice-of-anchor D domain-containing protein, partial [Nostoc sp. CHAB 5834]|nr:choice-of-anchor D domain-containing protein [Nostoc sp. CHAB 5834]
TNVQFPHTPIGDYSEPYHPVTLQNTGTGAIALSDLTLNDATNFYADMGNCQYLDTPLTLQPNDSCTLYLEASPVTVGNHATSATLYSSEGNVTLNLGVSSFEKIAVSVSEGATPYPLGYGVNGAPLLTSPVGVKNTRTFTVRNISAFPGAVHVRWRSYYYDNAVNFQHGLTQTNTCGTVLAPNATCNITVSYTPGEAYVPTPMMPNLYSWLLLIPGVSTGDLSPTDSPAPGAQPFQLNYKTQGVQMPVQVRFEENNGKYMITLKSKPDQQVSNLIGGDNGFTTGVMLDVLPDYPSIFPPQPPANWQKLIESYQPAMSGSEYSLYLRNQYGYYVDENGNDYYTVPIGSPSAWQSTFKLTLSDIYRGLELNVDLPNQQTSVQYWCLLAEVVTGSVANIVQTSPGLCSNDWGPGNPTGFANSPN